MPRVFDEDGEWVCTVLPLTAAGWHQAALGLPRWAMVVGTAVGAVPPLNASFYPPCACTSLPVTRDGLPNGVYMHDRR